MATMTQHPFWVQFAELFDYVEDVRVWVKDRDGRFSWVNRAVLLMDATNGHEGEQGQDAHGILGQTDYDRSPAFLADQYRLDDEYVLAGNRIVNRIELIRQLDGTSAWHVTNKIPLSDGTGAVIGTAGIARRLNASSQRSLSGIEFGPVLLYLRDNHHAANNESTTGPAGAHVGAGVRTQIPQQLPSHAAEIPAEPADAYGGACPGLHRPVAGPGGLELRLCQPEPLLAGVPPLLWPDSPRIPRALCPGKGRRSWNKTCRSRAMTDLLWAAIILPSSRPPSQPPKSPLRRGRWCASDHFPADSRTLLAIQGETDMHLESRKLGGRARLALGALLCLFVIGFARTARGAEDLVPFDGEKSSWHGFDRYDFLMDEANLTIKPYKVC
jgi:hypothetical protein